MGRLLLVFLSVALVLVNAANNDRFNYRTTNGTDFGPTDWDEVTCDDVGKCLGWPDGWELGKGWSLEENNCRWCPDTGNNCGVHHQSPIDLKRSDATTGHDPECYDFHLMAYNDGSCDWHDIVKNPYSIHSNNFKIERHSLQILQPLDEAGKLQCKDGHEAPEFPRLDYSKGFPDFWHLSHTELTVPSEHTQEGKRYSAEVHLSHFYSIDFTRHIGKVGIFLEVDSNKNRKRWSYLDKLICQWREVEETIRDECGIESVQEPYPGCRNRKRQNDETNLPYIDPYPFIDCDSVTNSQRMCKTTSCCESERSNTDYCQTDVYDKYGDDIVGSICWWCCPGKLLTRADGGPPPGITPTPPPVKNNNKSTPTPIPTPPLVPPPVPTPTPTPHPVPPPKPPSTTKTLPPVVPVIQPTPIAVPVPIAPTPTHPPVATIPTIVTTRPPNIPIPTFTPTKKQNNIVCSDYDSHPTININRICRGCCNPIRSATDHCHFVYKFFDEDMESVCADCCHPAKKLGPPPPDHPIYPPLDCTTVTANPYRICKPNSCCDNFSSMMNGGGGSFCNTIYANYTENKIKSICWYCCSEPIDIDEEHMNQNRRNLKLRSSKPKKRQKQKIIKDEVLTSSDDQLLRLSSKLSATETIQDSRKLKATEQFKKNSIVVDDKKADYDGRHQENQSKIREQEEKLIKQRNLNDGSNELNGSNYINVKYSPYEWLREVKTEYYFRYEGTQMVPPCYGTVHYRIMKDPIRIHPDQLTELERLLAWRIAPKGSEFNECQRDSAGTDRQGSNGNAVDLNRPLQSYQNTHYKVFCSCKDWDSRFQEDQDWCEDFNDNERRTTHPYNYDSGGTY